MDALVLAGGAPGPGGLLYEYTQGKSKAMLDMCGRPMVQWVLDALEGSAIVDRVVVIGLSPSEGLQSSKIRAYLPGEGSMIQNVRLGIKQVLELNPQARHMLVVSSDIPAITPVMVDWMVTTCMQTDDDLYYNVIQRQVMEKRYPNSRRTYLRVKDVEVCGGDMSVISTQISTEKDSVFERLSATRKNVLQQAAIIGWGTLFKVLLRRITLQEAVQAVCKRVGLKGRAILCPYAEVGMDVDKPFQLEMMRQDLIKRVLE